MSEVNLQANHAKERHVFVMAPASRSRVREFLDLASAALEKCPPSVALVLLGLIVVFRMPQTISPPQFWAEEFSIFYAEERRLGLAALFKTYAGYLHLYPRILALLTSWVPFEWAPFAYKAVSVLSAVFVGYFVAICRIPVSKAVRTFLILFVGLVPGSGEVYLNTANAITLAGAVGILLYGQEPATKFGAKVAESLALVVCGLSGAFMIFLFPLVAYRLILTDWPRRVFYRFVSLGIVSIINLIFYQAGYRFQGGASRDWEAWLDAIIKFNNSYLYGHLPVDGSGAHILAGSVMLLMVHLAYHAVRSFGLWRSFKSEALFFVSCGFSVWLASIYLFRATPNMVVPYDGGGRYFYLPYFFLTLGSLCAFSLSGRAKLFSQAIIATSTLCAILSLRPIPIVIQYKDFHFAEQVKEIRQGKRTVLSIPPGWDIDIGGIQFP